MHKATVNLAGTVYEFKGSGETWFLDGEELISDTMFAAAAEAVSKIPVPECFSGNKIEAAAHLVSLFVKGD